MFDLGMQEILVTLVVALVFIGPRKLPEIARSLGKLMVELRRAAEELKGQIDLDSVVDDIEKLSSTYSGTPGAVASGHQEQPAAPPPPAPSSETGSPSHEPQGSNPAHERVQEKAPEKTET